MQKHLYFYLIPILLLMPAGSYAGQNSTDSIPLSLSQAVERALENNLNLKLRQEDVLSAEGVAQSTKGRFDTLLSAEVGTEIQELAPMYQGAAEDENSSLLGAGVQKRFTTGTEVQLGWKNTRFDSDAADLLLNPAYNTTLSLGISQPLLRGWGMDIQTAETQAAEKQLEASLFQVDSLAADLAAQVKNAYWNLVFAWQDIEVQQLSLTLANKLLEETEAKIKAGKLAEVEVYQPQSEVARREENLIAAERAIGVAEDELKLLLNSENWLTPFTPTDIPKTTPVQLDQEMILVNALSNRPDVKAADLNIEATGIQTALAEDNTRPSLALVGSVGYGGTNNGYGDALDAAVNDPDTQWQMGLNFSVPLGNSYAEGTLVQAKAAHNKARTNAQLLQLQVKKAVRTTVRDVHLAIKAMEATRKTSLATMKRLEAELAKFQAGRATTLDVLIAQDAYSQALSVENKTNIVYEQSLAEIDRIQGMVTLSSHH